MKETTGQVECILPVEVATFLLNEKRKAIQQLEKRQNTRVIVVPNPYMQTPQYEVRRLKTGEENQQVSYSMAQQPEFDSTIASEPEMVKTSADAPAVSMVAPAGKMPVVPKKKPVTETTNKPKTPGIIASLLHRLFGIGDKPEADKKQKPNNQRSRSRNPRYKGKNQGRRSPNQNRNQQNQNRNQNNQNRNQNNQNRKPETRVQKTLKSRPLLIAMLNNSLKDKLKTGLRLRLKQ